MVRVLYVCICVTVLVHMYVCVYVPMVFTFNCLICIDPIFDVMQTISEPTTGDDTCSLNTSPTPSSDDGQDHMMTKRSTQDGLSSHFKKRKPMKPTSRTSINNLVENKMEDDAESD